MFGVLVRSLIHKHDRSFSTLNPCEKLEILEQKSIDLINNRPVPNDMNHAKQLHQEEQNLLEEITIAHRQCETMKETNRKTLIAQYEQNTKKERKEKEEKLQKDAPIFFNYLVDLIQNDSPQMKASLLKHVQKTGDSRRIVVFSTSEWDSFALSPNLVPHNARSMVFQTFSRKITQGSFVGYILQGEQFWQPSIFILPTKEQRILLIKK